MTPVGPLNKTKERLSRNEKNNLAEVINECFELLALNYQHLYFSAYPTTDTANLAKRLWLENLESFTPDTILAATHAIIKESDYLPTISKLIKKCQLLAGNNTLPDARSAYIEACNANSPKQNHPWSHAVIYYAGQSCNWHFLANNEEAIAYPVFKGHYEKLCEQIAEGLQLPEIQKLALPESVEIPLTKVENAKKMAQLKRELDL